jgi:alkylation response protein AidB-like acyl-CoA dehydrogenase
LEAFMVIANVKAARNPDAAAAQEPDVSEAARLLAAVGDLAPGLAARSEEIEGARRVPRDIVDTLQRIGVFRTLVPRSHGGLQLTVPEVVPVIAALSAADSSVGWVAMIVTTSQTFCSRLPKATYDRIFADGPDAIVVGAGTPAGRADMVDGGYRITGRWPFSSGCQNAQWIVGHCVIFKDGEPVMSEHGPVTKFFILPAESWRVEETWYASGLTGSGSHHVALDNVEASDAFGFDLLHGESCLPGPFESSVAPFIGSFHAAVAVGIAMGAVADLRTMANAGRRQLFAAADLRDSQMFQHEFGRIGAELSAVQALSEVQSAKFWNRALEGTLDGKADFAEALRASAWIHATCAGIVDRCYTLGGASVVFNSSPLQRRLRDIHAAKQHVFAQERFYASAGAHDLGFPPFDPITGR